MTFWPKGLNAGLHRIERLWHQEGLPARPRRRGLPKYPEQRLVASPNLLDGTFEASAPNQKWIADFTHIWTARAGCIKRPSSICSLVASSVGRADRALAFGVPKVGSAPIVLKKSQLGQFRRSRWIRTELGSRRQRLLSQNLRGPFATPVLAAIHFGERQVSPAALTFSTLSA